MIHPEEKGGVAVFEGAQQEASWKVGQTLTIGKIINHKGESVSSLMLEPQGIAHLISQNCVDLPSDVCGLAHVLTRMCNRGLLTLDIGVIDPGWNNHLSTPVLNFSSERRLLQVGDPFIRVTYHKIQMAPGAQKRDLYPNSDSREYDRAIRARAVGGFGKSFLNIKQLVGRASKKENARFKESMLKYIPIGAFSLAIFALLVTVGIATVARLAGGDRQDEILERLNKIERALPKAVASRETVPAEDGANSKDGPSRGQKR